jgi:hypothetical protein
MKSWAAAAWAAAVTCSRLASGFPKAIFSRIVPENRGGLLQDDSDLRAEGIQGQVTQIIAVYSDRPFAGVIEARQQVDDGRLSRAGGAQQGDRIARLGLETDVFQNGLSALEIAEGYVLEADVTLPSTCGKGTGRRAYRRPRSRRPGSQRCARRRQRPAQTGQ